MEGDDTQDIMAANQLRKRHPQPTMYRADEQRHAESDEET